MNENTQKATESLTAIFMENRKWTKAIQKRWEYFTANGDIETANAILYEFIVYKCITTLMAKKKRKLKGRPPLRSTRSDYKLSVRLTPLEEQILRDYCWRYQAVTFSGCT